MKASKAAMAAAGMTKRALPLGRLLVGTLLAMPTATYLINRFRGYDPRKQLDLQSLPMPTMAPEAYGELAARLAASRALLGMEGFNRPTGMPPLPQQGIYQ